MECLRTCSVFSALIFNVYHGKSIYPIPGVPPILLAGFVSSSEANENHYGGIFFSHVFLENRNGGLYVNVAVGSLHNECRYVSERTS